MRDVQQVKCRRRCGQADEGNCEPQSLAGVVERSDGQVTAERSGVSSSHCRVEDEPVRVNEGESVCGACLRARMKTGCFAMDRLHEFEERASCRQVAVACSSRR